MIVLDTNVLSALMRTNPEVVVVEWLDRQPADSVWLTSITVLEARFGLALLPKGRRRSGLERAFDRVLAEDLSNRVLALDSMAAVTAAQLAADRQRAGRVADLRDTLIAGIAQSRRATIATRNTRHFEGLVDSHSLAGIVAHKGLADEECMESGGTQRGAILERLDDAYQAASSVAKNMAIPPPRSSRPRMAVRRR